MITLAPKEFSIQAAHCLDIEGIAPKCKRQHGHTWWVRVWFVGNPNADGVLVPYGLVAEVAGKYDHQDLNAVMDCNSTGENLLMALVSDFNDAIKGFAWHPRLKRIEVVEAPTRAGDGHLLAWDEADHRVNELAKSLRMLIANVDTLRALAATQPGAETVAILDVRRSALVDALDLVTR